MKKLLGLFLAILLLGGCLGLDVKITHVTEETEPQVVEEESLDDLLALAEGAGGKWSDYGLLAAANIVDGDDFLIRDVSDTPPATGNQKRYSWASMKTDLGSADFTLSADVDMEMLNDVTGEGNSGYILEDDGDGTYSFTNTLDVTLGGFTANRTLVSDGSGDAIVSSGITLESTTSIDLDTPAKARNAIIINNADSVLDVTLPPAAAGLDVWVYSRYAQVVTIDVDDGVDVILLNGATVGAGDSIDSPGTVGDYIHLVAIDSTYWITLEQQGVWIDGGP